MSLESLIRIHFNASKIPTQNELVKFDGFDQLEKESAVKRFLGKSWEEVYNKIVSHGGFGTGSDIEELLVMEPYGLQYYLKSYLLYCIKSEAEPRYENETVHFLIWTLREIFRIRGVQVFTVEQRPLIRQFVVSLLIEIKDVDDDEAVFPFVRSMKEYVQDILRDPNLQYDS